MWWLFVCRIRRVFPHHTHHNLKIMSNPAEIDGYFDLKNLSAYCSLGVPTLRDYLRSGGLPHFKLKGKILVKKSEFDQWLESFRIKTNQELNGIIDSVLESLTHGESDE